MSRRLRVVGGHWRSRQIDFPAVEAIRPTPDRVRETLFNWLAGDIHGARCLEPFAGSGILTIEALSRGASHCTVIDVSAQAVDSLQQNLKTLGANPASFDCFHKDAGQWLETYEGGAFDIAFLDPPFAEGVSKALIQQVAHHLSEDGLIYIETAVALEIKALPENLAIYRQKRAGAVHYALLRKEIRKGRSGVA